MTWLCLLLLIVVAMIVLEAAGAARNFRRSREPSELVEAGQVLPGEMLFGRPRR
jgi:hypothetical protein